MEASATCWNWICRCLVGVGSICNLLELDMQIHIGVNSGRGSICNLLELDLQMPGWGWKHLQFAGYEFVDTYPGVGSICNLLELDLQMPGRGWKHLQLAGIGFADAWSGLEASATCWNWICRCLVGVGSIHNLLDMNLQMPITKLILRILQQLRWDCFLCRKKSKMFSWTCGAYRAKI